MKQRAHASPFTLTRLCPVPRRLALGVMSLSMRAAENDGRSNGVKSLFSMARRLTSMSSKLTDDGHTPESALLIHGDELFAKNVCRDVRRC